METLKEELSLQIKIMRIILFAILSLGLFITSCSSQGDMEDKNPVSSEEGIVKEYLGINLASAPTVSSISRGDADDFQYGQESENKINKVRFYFFREDGVSANVIKKTEGTKKYDCFYDWTPTAADLEKVESSPPGNVELIATTVVEVYRESGKHPAQVVAVVNPPSMLANLSVSNISSLQETVYNFHRGLTSGNFVMSNSVYVGSDVGSPEGKIEVVGTKIDESQFSETTEDLMPVTIYVERVLARLDVKFDNSKEGIHPANIKDLDNVFSTGVKFTPKDSETSKDIYVHFLGWGITSSPNKSRLIKKVEPSWSQEEFFSIENPWNIEAFHRSYWAENPRNFTSNDYTWWSYRDLLPGSGNNESVNLIADATAYMQENGSRISDEDIISWSAQYPTKAIFAAQLIDEDGNPVTVAQYEARQYTLEGLKSLIANELDIYTPAPSADGEEIKDASGTIYRKIKASDIDFETASRHNSISGPDNAEKTYNVYFVLTNEAKNKEWYHRFDPQENERPVKVDDTKKYIDDKVKPARVWNEGRAYYYFTIPHYQGNDKSVEGADDPTNGNNESVYGVVRNHVYTASVIKISNLGTPVYDPNEIIYPETPEDMGIPMEVSVGRTEWRNVKQNFQLAW